MISRPEKKEAQRMRRRGNSVKDLWVKNTAIKR